MIRSKDAEDNEMHYDHKDGIGNSSYIKVLLCLI